NPVPAPTVLARPAGFAERFGLEDFPTRVIELAVRFRLDLVVLGAGAGSHFVVAPFALDRRHALGGHQVDRSDHAFLRAADVAKHEQCTHSNNPEATGCLHSNHVPLSDEMNLVGSPTPKRRRAS